MPTYCYRHSSKGIIERFFPMGEAPQAIHLDGLTANRDYQAERVSVPATKGWPMEPCCASGVHPKQAQELRDGLREAGVPTEVRESGDPVYTSAAHQKKALKVRGFRLNSFS